MGRKIRNVIPFDNTNTDWPADLSFAMKEIDLWHNIWSNISSAVRLFGGIIQDNGDGTVRVGAGGGIYKVDASSIEGVPAGECEPMGLNSAQGGKIYYHEWDEKLNVYLTNNAYNYIFIVWDHTKDNGDGTYGGTDIVASTNFYMADWEQDPLYYNFKDEHPELDLPARRSAMLHAHTVGRVYKMDNEIIIRVCGTNAWNFNKRVQLFGEEFFPVIRARGLDIEPIAGTLQFNVTEGIMWAEMANRFTVREFNMELGDRFYYWYQHTALETPLTLSNLQTTYPDGYSSGKYSIFHSSTDDKYYRYNYNTHLWAEVMDYIDSKLIKNTTYNSIAELSTANPTGYYNMSEDDPENPGMKKDYVLLQLQSSDAYYKFNQSTENWDYYGPKSTVLSDDITTIAFIGDADLMNELWPSGYTGKVNVIIATLDGKYYEYSGVEGVQSWQRVHGYVERNGWLRFYNQSAVDPSRYNNTNTNQLEDIPLGSYGVAWIYMCHDNTCHVVYGQDYYTNEEAKQAALPTPLPGLLAAYSTLVGKMTFTQGGTAFENAESPFLEKFISSGVALHNDLAGLDGGDSGQNKYYHLNELDYNNILSTRTQNSTFTITNGKASTSITSGALVVTGGTGISGELYVGNDITAWASSDKNLKDDIIKIDNALEKIDKIGGYNFNWNTKALEMYPERSIQDVGVIAQEIQEVIPEAVIERDNGYLAVQYDKIIPLLIESIKALKAEIEELKK